MPLIIKNNFMKIENQVCSVEQAKKLKDLGIAQESIFTWYGKSLRETAYIGCPRCGSVLNGIKPPQKLVEALSAFTVAELGVLLGNGVTMHKPKQRCNEAFDRADDLIHLLEINELLVDSCNERLIA